MRQEQRTGTQSLIRACYCPGLLIRFWKLETAWIYLSIYLHLSVCAKLKESRRIGFPKNRLIHHRECMLVTLMQHCRLASSFFCSPRSPNRLDCVRRAVLRNKLHSFFLPVLWTEKTWDSIQKYTLTSKRPLSRLVEAIHLVQYQPSSESGITHHASAVVGHILYYLMEYSLLSCRSTGT